MSSARNDPPARSTSHTITKQMTVIPACFQPESSLGFDRLKTGFRLGACRNDGFLTRIESAVAIRGRPQDTV